MKIRKKKWSKILKMRGYQSFLDEYDNNLSLIKDYLKMDLKIDTKSISRILKGFKKYQDEKSNIPVRNTNDIQLALKELQSINSDSQELSRSRENGKSPNGCL